MPPTKKPAKMANRNVGLEAIKDDGDKYRVIRDGAVVYGGEGVALAEAVRLATTLQAPAGIAKVEGDELVAGTLSDDGVFIAFADREAVAA